MELSIKQYNIIFLAIVSFILIISIFNWVDYLLSNKYITECFTTGQTQEDYGSSISHTVNLPLTTTYSCQNFCGPNAKCAITGQQCFADIDCLGCKPYSPQDYSPQEKKAKECVPGNDDAGKLTSGVTPQYSSLTSGYGTKEKIITKNMYDRPAQANFGVDTWSKSFNEGQILFNKRYKPNQLQYMPNYPPMYSITGEFIGDGPLPSNY